MSQNLFVCYFHCWLLVLYHSGVCSILVQNCTSSLLPHSVWSTKCPGFIYTCPFRPETLQALISVLNMICFYLWIQHTIPGDVCFLSLKICRRNQKNNVTALFFKAGMTVIDPWKFQDITKVVKNLWNIYLVLHFFSFYDIWGSHRSVVLMKIEAFSHFPCLYGLRLSKC